MSLRVIEWPSFLEEPPPEFCAAMTIGVFDGVHLGHQALIERIVRRGPNPTVVTFRENPKKALCRIAGDKTSGSYKGDLYSLRQKTEVFDSLGVKFLVLIDFSEDFSKLKGREFLDLLGQNGKMAFLAVGNNFRCGFAQDTGADLARQINESKRIPTELVPPVYLRDGAATEPVSSSFIRKAILAGNLKLASELLGRNFSLDLSDLRSEHLESGYVYDLCSVNRIAPADGEYSVLVFPNVHAGGMNAGIACRASAKEGKIFLPIEAESLEFIRSE
jgi:riboflavin kinase/FMN adenylyltransferase